MYTSGTFFRAPVVSNTLRKALEPLLAKHRVDLGLWSHIHSYERTCRVLGHACVPPGAPEGTVHVVVGTGGGGLHAFRRPAGHDFAHWSRRRLQQYGFLRLRANTTDLNAEFVASESGQLLDHFALRKD
eukprot:NODE_654_length_1241_cov_68.747483_g473_i0.p1 GENE.NODE_654_length_1241_cov_68.747483_g473_i0~~NODE_654_length_1241_cov_68.747483_g473_i0.p1  ORF type:complete len:129 (+),score=33.14 NODE_654_length_1241_cov_68.747483_g473_i0:839-1225(+)